MEYAVLLHGVSRSSSRITLEPGPAGEGLSNNQPAVSDPQRQRRQWARGRPADYLCRFLRIVERVMARAVEQLGGGVPVGHVAAGVRAYRRVGDDAFRGTLLGHRIEALRIEAKQQHLVEPRAIAHGAACRVDRPSKGLLGGERYVIRRQWLGGSVADGNQKIAFSRSFACGIA